MSRPLPWHDTPRCTDRACNGPIISAEMASGWWCGACGATFHPSAPKRAQLLRAEAAWGLVLEGKVHEDKACARCGGVLPIEQQRLCPPCARADSEERTLPLFP